MRGSVHVALVLVFRHQQLCRDHQQRQSADQLEVRQVHQRHDDAGEDNAQENGDAGAKHHAPEPLPRRQAPACHRDDKRVVTRQQDVDPHDLAERDPEGRLLHLGLKLGEERRDVCRIKNLQQPVHSVPPPRPFGRARGYDAASSDQPTISLPEKNCAISIAAVSVASEPCTEFSPMDFAWTLRIVPSAAFDGSVAPITSRYLSTAPSPSSTCTTTGPEVMKSTSSPKNGRALWPA